MALENAIRFNEMLAVDSELQAKLRAVWAAYDGPKDEKSVFGATIEVLAAEVGLPFTYEEAVAAASSREVPDDELDAVAGGACFIVGWQDEPNAYVCDSVAEGIAVACAYVGITAGND